MKQSKLRGAAELEEKNKKAAEHCAKAQNCTSITFKSNGEEISRYLKLHPEIDAIKYARENIKITRRYGV